MVQLDENHQNWSTFMYIFPSLEADVILKSRLFLINMLLCKQEKMRHLIFSCCREFHKSLPFDYSTVQTFGPVTQSSFLQQMGIDTRMKVSGARRPVKKSH